MATKYLDSTGLAHFWEKIKAYGNSHWAGGGGGGSVLDFYPVGSYYETSDTSFNPNTAWGGTWSLETAGQVHVSAGTGYAVAGALTNTTDGGNKNAIIPYHTHTLSRTTGVAVSVTSSGACDIASSGGHSHTITSYYKQQNAASGTARNTPNTGAQTATNLATIASNSGTHTHKVPNHTHTTSVTQPVFSAAHAGTEGNLTNANMQPYIVVNRWHRTA